MPSSTSRFARANSASSASEFTPTSSGFVAVIFRVTMPHPPRRLLLADEHDAVTHGQHHVLHAVVLRDQVVQFSSRLRKLALWLEHLALAQGIVDRDQPALRNERNSRAVVIGVVVLVGIDEDEV